MNYLRLAHVALIGIFASGLLSASVLTQVRKKYERSFYENRNLAQLPTLSLKGIWDGSFQHQYDSFVTDQFIFRRQWIRLWVLLQMCLGRPIVQNYYVDSDNWILPVENKRILMNSEKRSAEIVNSIAQGLKMRGKRVYLARVPHRTLALMPVRYPTFLRTNELQKSTNIYYDYLDLKSMHAININESMIAGLTAKEIESLYFRTDHHWTAEGAFLGYRILVDQLIKDGYPLRQFRNEDYELEGLQVNNFLGSYNRQLFGFVPEESSIKWYRCRIQDYHNYQLSVGGFDCGRMTGWDDIYMNTKDKRWVAYGDLFSSDYQQITIQNVQAACDHHVLIVKDSYFNPLLVYMPVQFRVVTIVDPRKWQKGDARKFILNSEADTVIFFISDTNTSVNYFECLE